MSIDSRGARGVVGHLPTLQAHAITVAAVTLLVVLAALGFLVGLVMLDLFLRVVS